MPKRNGAPESIFLSTLPTPDAALIDEKLTDSWDQVLRMRDEILKALEKSRKPPEGENIIGHIIGHSLDAEVLIYPDMYDSGPKEIFGAQGAQTWGDILIVSKVKVERGETPFNFDWERAKDIRKTIGQAGSFSIIHVDGREGRMYDSPLFNGPVVVFRAQGQKCERCWKYDKDVKEPAMVCPRCSAVLGPGVLA
jgi:isoleucyl-tRNA synthetase